MRMIDAHSYYDYFSFQGDQPMNAQARRPTNLSLDSLLLTEAKALKVNLSRAAEEGVRAAVAAAKVEQWQAENAEALESSNSYVVRHGLPLEKHRQF
jgi:antitoxin CcdA